MNKVIQKAGDNSEQYNADIINIDKTVHNYPEKVSKLEALIKEYHKEREDGDTQFKTYIDKIQHYQTSQDGQIFLGLEKKLLDGGYEFDYDWAVALKDEYAKRIVSNQFSKATQKIHAYLLAKILVQFNNFVLPAIRKGTNQETVKQLIMDKVIDPIEHLIGDENVLDLYADDINAMIYFLTGNCHIKWK